MALIIVAVADIDPERAIIVAAEVAKAVVFLLSDMASYVAGHTLLVDGGWMAAYTIGVPPNPEGGALDARKRADWSGLTQASEMKPQAEAV